MTDQLLARVADGVGHLTLDRPEALNSLSYAMIGELTAILDAWRHDPEVAVVILDGAGDRGFCAGGDVRELYRYVSEGRLEEARRFFHEEYHLDAAIAEYPKPVVAIMDGITMGGGVGLAGHAAIRIVTERSRIAMPETRIGFTPDVGGSMLLARAPGRLGEYLGLNAATMDGSDAIAVGFADYFVPSERLPALCQALAERADPGTPSEIVLLFDETPEPSRLLAQRAWIDACYSGETVAEIVERLREVSTGSTGGGGGSDGADAAAAELERLSPTALTVTLAAVRSARGRTLRETLEQEYRLVDWFLGHPDLREGIRAQVVEKDRSPRWSPATLGELDPGLAEAALRHPLPGPLWE